METKKITEGCVSQIFEDGKCVHQEFTASDAVDYEDEFGDLLPPEKVKAFQKSEVYHPFNMVQPSTITITVKGGLIQDIDFPPSFRGVKVVVKDYDVDGFSEGIKKDDDGEYVSSEWEA